MCYIVLIILVKLTQGSEVDTVKLPILEIKIIAAGKGSTHSVFSEAQGDMTKR